MKTLIKQTAVLAIIVVLFAMKSFGASADYLLEIKGVDGECKGKLIKLTENPDGSFTATNIPSGKYEIIYKAKTGKTGSAKRGEAPVTVTYEAIVSPRDAASGLPTGKRQHKPFVITKELDMSSPHNMLGGILIGDLDGDGVLDIPNDGTAKGHASPGYDLAINKKI